MRYALHRAPADSTVVVIPAQDDPVLGKLRDLELTHEHTI
jgi:hypothetical protein